MEWKSAGDEGLKRGRRGNGGHFIGLRPICPGEWENGWMEGKGTIKLPKGTIKHKITFIVQFHCFFRHSSLFAPRMDYAISL